MRGFKRKLSSVVSIIVILILFNMVFTSCSLYKKFTDQNKTETDIVNNSAEVHEKLSIEEQLKVDEQLNVDELSIEEQAKILTDLGISGMTDRVIEEAKEADQQFPEYPFDSFINLLGVIGYGSYDYDTEAWTPISTEVYGFDTEAFDIEKMYTDFMNGIIAISKDEFSITNINENLDEVNFDKGTGTQTISFKYNKHSYKFKGKVNNDWMDCRIIDFMNDVFEKEDNPKRLLCMPDGGQSYFVFYNTIEWAKEFTRKTQIPLSESYKYNKYIEP